MNIQRYFQISVSQDDIGKRNFKLFWKFNIVRNSKFLPLSQWSGFVKIYSMIYFFIKDIKFTR